MADNVDVTAGSGTTLATDDVSSVHYQRVKVDVGGDGVSSPLVRGQQTKANSLGVTLASDEDALAVTNADMTTVAGAVSGTEMQVDVVAALPAGTNAIGKLAANSGVDIGDVDVTSMPGVAGDTAHDAADSGNPVGTGAQARTTNPTAVGDGDRVRVVADDVGRLVTVSAIRDLTVSASVQTTNTTKTTLLAAGGAGVFHDITSLVITNETATATVVTLDDNDGAGTAYKFALAASGGIVVGFNPPLKQGAANDIWSVTSSATVTLNHVVNAVKNI